jgi:hypothetical protein
MAQAVPPNDNCADATPVNLGTAMPFDGAGATTDGSSTCTLFGAGDRDMWYSYTPSASATLQVQPSAAFGAAVISLYSACPGTPSDTSAQIDCQTSGTGGVLATFPVTGGRPYLIRFAAGTGVGGFAGTLTFTQLTTPANNSCGAGIPALTTGTAQAFNWAGATTENTTTCGQGVWDIWYKWTASFTGTAGATVNSNNILVGVFSDCPIGNSTASEIDSVSFTSGSAAARQVTFAATSGMTYYVRLARNGSAAATTGGTLTMAQQTPIPANNARAAATPLLAGSGAQAFTLVGATRDGTISGSTNMRGTPDVWFSYTAAATPVTTQILLAGTLGSSSNATTIGVFEEPSGTQIASASGTGTIGRSVLFAPTPGQTYTIRVARLASTSNVGAGTIAVNEFAPLENDTCGYAAANPIGSGPGVYSWDNTIATTDATPAGCTRAGTKDVWFAYTAWSTGIAVFDTSATAGSTVDTVVHIYNTCPPAGVVLACNDAANSTFNGAGRACTHVIANSTYIVRISSANEFATSLPTAYGPGLLNINEYPEQLNDTCAAALPIGEGNTGFDTTGTCSSGAKPACLESAAATDSNLWYVYTPTQTGVVTLDTCAGATNTVLSVFDSCGGSEKACSNDTCGVAARLNIPTTLGQPLYIRLSIGAGAFGGGVLSVTQVTPMPNDDCAGAIPISPGATIFDVSSASDVQTAYFDPCTLGDPQQTDVWYSYTPARSGTAAIDTCSVSEAPPNIGQTVLAVWASCAATSPLQCSVNADVCPGGNGSKSKITMPMTKNTRYLIRYSKRYGTLLQGTIGQINITYTPAPCAADFNASATLEVQDIFDFLNAWFAGSPTADFNGGGLAVQDIFDYLNAWFAGCP